MDCQKIGSLIFQMRKEKQMTQKQVATLLNVSDKAVSKWERGLGCPDVTLLKDLSSVLGINLKELLTGEIISNEENGGNMKRTKFYICQDCGNLVTATNKLDLSCCGRNLLELTGSDATDAHSLKIAKDEDEIIVTMSHPMTKEHYISFIAYLTDNKLQLTKLYPEQDIEVRFKRAGRGQIFAYCNTEGFYKVKM